MVRNSSKWIAYMTTLKTSKNLLLPEEECGLFGIYGMEDAATHTALGLHALQHRGQEAAGIVAYDGEQFHSHRALGLVGDNFN